MGKRIRARTSIRTLAILVVVIVIAVAGIFSEIVKNPGGSSSSASASYSARAEQLNSTLTLSSPDSTGKLLIQVGFPGILIASPTISWMNYSLTFSTSASMSNNFSLSVSTPSELEARFSSNSVSPGSNQSTVILQLASPAGSVAGNYQFTISATGGGITFRANETADVLKYLVVTVGTSFIPQNLTVSQGSTVTWLRLNGALSPSDSGAHDVDFSSGISMVSPTLLQYGSWNYTFNQVGNYSYYCKYHPFMTGKITVITSN